MKEKRLVDANHFMQVLKNIEYALKGELTHGKIKTSVVQMIEGSLNAEPTIAPESLQPLTYNENRDYIDCDEFICHKCGIHVEDWKQIKIDPDDGEKELCEYTFKHCPECGAKVTSHKSCEFCRWHLQDGTCFNKHHSQPVTGREASCWNWEERERWKKSVSPAHGMITFHGCASMEILSIGRISQTRKIAALCGKEGKIVMKKKKSEFGAYAIGWLYLLAPVIILAVVLVVKYFIAASDLPDWFKFALLK